MSLAQIKEEVGELSSEERGELMAYLGAMQVAHDEEFRADLTSRIDDKDPAHWVELDDLKARWAD